MDLPTTASRTLETRLLRYVIAVGEELHFGNAANRLHVSTPALSKQIKDLEVSLGYALFDRRTREVLLTAAGAAFIEEARLALLHADRAVDLSKAVSRGDTGVLSIGYSTWFGPSRLVALQPALAERVPGTSLVLQSGTASAQIDLVCRGSLHAAIVELPVHAAGVKVHGIWRDELMVVVSARHRLAESAEIDPNDLESEALIWVSSASHPSLHEQVMNARIWLGRPPHLVHEINTLPELLDLVSAGLGIGLLKRSAVGRPGEHGVVFRELRGPALVIETGLVHRSDSKSRALKAFLELVAVRSP